MSYFRIPAFLVPSPLVMLESLWTHLSRRCCWRCCSPSKITLISFLLSIVIGAAVAFILVQNRFVETALFPYIVFLQVTPIVAIAPLIIIWVKGCHALAGGVRHPDGGVSHHLQYHSRGLRSVSPACLAIFASITPAAGKRWCGCVSLGAAHFFRRAAYFQWAVADWRGGGAEFVAGTGGTNTGLAYQILQAGYQLDIPLMFRRAAADLSRRYRAVWRDVPGSRAGRSAPGMKAKPCNLI